jgi:3-(3-hydroxy-phenyl)propionate hydroxylase
METLNSVVIVGGGPAGLFTALKLGRAGIAVTVLEADGCVMNSPRAVAYHWPTIQSLERLGVLDDVLKQGVKAHEIANRRLDGSPQAVLDHNVLNGHLPYN